MKKEAYVPFYDPFFRESPLPSENRQHFRIKPSPSRDSNPACSDRMPSLYHLRHHHCPSKTLQLGYHWNVSDRNNNFFNLAIFARHSDSYFNFSVLWYYIKNGAMPLFSGSSMKRIFRILSTIMPNQMQIHCWMEALIH